MKRLLFAAAALLCAVGFAVPGFAQYTTVTATQLKMGGVLIPSGTITVTPVNNIGQPIPVVTSDGTLNAPQGFSATITNGTIASGFSVPDQLTSVATQANTPISYQVMIYNSSSKTSFSLTIPGTGPVVTGSSFALDHYTPAQTATVSPAGLLAVTVVPAHCTVPSKLYTIATPSVSYNCVGGVPVQETTSGVTAPTLETLPFSTSPSFSATTTYSRITLTGNVTSSTIPAGSDGALKTFFVCQDSAGAHSFTFPPNVFGAGMVGATSNTCSQQIFSYSLLTGHVGWYAAGIMVTNL